MHKTLVTKEGLYKVSGRGFLLRPSWSNQPLKKLQLLSCFTNLWIFSWQSLPAVDMWCWPLPFSGHKQPRHKAVQSGTHTSVWELLTKQRGTARPSATFPNWVARNIPPHRMDRQTDWQRGGQPLLCIAQNLSLESTRLRSHLALTQQSPNLPATPFFFFLVLWLTFLSYLRPC